MSGKPLNLNEHYATARRQIAAISRLALIAGRVAEEAKTLPSDRLERMVDDMSEAIRKARRGHKTQTPAKAAPVENRLALRLTD